jgi:hypothetical protein
MGDIDTVAAPERAVGRRIAGWVTAVLAAAIAVLTVLGAWNPWDLVVLWRLFGNPLRGAALFFVLALVASWLLAPVRSEAQQVGRARWRIALALGLVVSLIGWGLFGSRFGTGRLELAHSPGGGQRTIVLYEPGTDFQRLHVWSGRGLGTRDVGDLGKPCGQTSVSFTGPDEIRVSTSYGQFDLRLDPATGRPLTTLGPTCYG